MEDKTIKIEQEEDDAGKQQQIQPPRKVTKIRGGQKRDYNFLQTINTVDELDNLRFKVPNLKNINKKMEVFNRIPVIGAANHCLKSHQLLCYVQGNERISRENNAILN
jgi:hypothetical protein